MFHSQANEDNIVEDPFSNFRIGQTLTAKIVSKTNKSESNKKLYQWELSIKPSLLTGKASFKVSLLGLVLNNLPH